MSSLELIKLFSFKTAMTTRCLDMFNLITGTLGSSPAHFWMGKFRFFKGRTDILEKMLGLINRVSEPACFGATPAPGIFYPEPAPGKREHNF